MKKRNLAQIAPDVTYPSMTLIKDDLEATINYHSREIDKFRHRFHDDPTSAFEWSSDAMKASAGYFVVKSILSWINHASKGDDYTVVSDRQVIEEIVKNLREVMLNGARYPHRSSSPMANFMAEEKLSANADWFIKLEKHLARWRD